MARKAKSLADANDERVRRSPGTSRHSRESEDVGRVKDDGLVANKAERRQLFKDEWTQEALPTPPAIDGYHLCWLSTTNQWDPIQRRVRIGYEPVKVTEVPGFEHLKIHSGEHSGCVAINEMVLFKIPLEIYQAAMRRFHHDEPLSEEQKIRDGIVELEAAHKDSSKRPLIQVEGEGLESIVQRARVPNFT